MSFTLIYNPELGKVLYELGTPSSTAVALLVHQIFFWGNTSSGYYTKDGKKWIYNSDTSTTEEENCSSPSEHSFDSAFITGKYLVQVFVTKFNNSVFGWEVSK